MGYLSKSEQHKNGHHVLCPAPRKAIILRAARKLQAQYVKAKV